MPFLQTHASVSLTSITWIFPALPLSCSLENMSFWRQLPVCRRKRRDFLRAAACWTQCSTFTQWQEPLWGWAGRGEGHSSLCTETRNHKHDGHSGVNFLALQSATDSLQGNLMGELWINSTWANKSKKKMYVCFLYHTLVNLLLVQRGHYDYSRCLASPGLQFDFRTMSGADSCFHLSPPLMNFCSDFHSRLPS